VGGGCWLTQEVSGRIYHPEGCWGRRNPPCEWGAGGCCWHCCLLGVSHPAATSPACSVWARCPLPAVVGAPGCTRATPRPLGSCSGLGMDLVCIPGLILSRFHPELTWEGLALPLLQGSPKTSPGSSVPPFPTCFGWSRARRPPSAPFGCSASPGCHRSPQQQPGSGCPRCSAPCSPQGFRPHVRPSVPPGWQLGHHLLLPLLHGGRGLGLAGLQCPCCPHATGVPSLVTRGASGDSLAWRRVAVSWTMAGGVDAVGHWDHHPGDCGIRGATEHNYAQAPTRCASWLHIVGNWMSKSSSPPPPLLLLFLLSPYSSSPPPPPPPKPLAAPLPGLSTVHSQCWGAFVSLLAGTGAPVRSAAGAARG